MVKSKKEFEKYILKVIAKYSKILLLERGSFSVKHGVSGTNSYMECKFNYPYLDTTIFYSDMAMNDWKNKKDITPFIVHEMCHVITDPLYAKANSRFVSENEILDERELLTDYISNIIIKNKL